ncbi:2Fe-2S iron-sulfur cluster binding domain-containing protein [Tistlia consotensis]|uniref:2Fe-2S iron-sulfur cluster binding domain-containing protein n=1 Tax=Tistlia consotensis USBA 355 TaxID=560819 RepID=A0A1Y6C376_9PROT|nr:(2Fe-2S)-binding protein [Tistlia consotensis]SMF31164.1 2Fe-2S iron-sulfur cluster binding domain-containing protein [Tistlia consotensis USBA 355]SNS19099.1 2Fe-2S iron-sulfur cluster binding domain-containing protein [Tistlia consotensis]
MIGAGKDAPGAGRVVRLAEQGRAPVRFRLDGADCAAMEGDTVLTAVLASVPALRRSEFGPEGRAGFCLMGACQDCWVWQEVGPRLRACSTPIAEGMKLLTEAPGDWT